MALSPQTELGLLGRANFRSARSYPWSLSCIVQWSTCLKSPNPAGEIGPHSLHLPLSFVSGTLVPKVLCNLVPFPSLTAYLTVLPSSPNLGRPPRYPVLPKSPPACVTYLSYPFRASSNESHPLLRLNYTSSPSVHPSNRYRLDLPPIRMTWNPSKHNEGRPSPSVASATSLDTPSPSNASPPPGASAGGRPPYLQHSRSHSSSRLVAPSVVV